MTIQHEDIQDPKIHEPKGISTATAGQVYKADGIGSGAWADESPTGTIIGLADYNDAGTATTPISVPGTNTFVNLTNDALGSFTNLNYLPPDVTQVWDSVTNTFDWSELQLGDMVDIRLDLEVTTTAANQLVEVVLELGVGGSSYQIPFAQANIKTAGTYSVNRFNGVYMGDANTRDNPAVFKVKSDAAATVKVNGWYCKIITNR